METKRLVIRRFKPEDWPDLYEYLSQEATVKHEPYDIFSEEAAKEEAAKRSNDNSFWAVCLQDSGKLIGNIYMNEQDFDTWELGYVFNMHFLGKGYATEAANAVIHEAINHQNARRIIAFCSPLNKPSWRLLERLGLRREGHLLKNIYFKKDPAGDPIWLDTYEYGILADEWMAIRGNLK
jgi:RimJ/RimL family protein N-acetyltransferase